MASYGRTCGPTSRYDQKTGETFSVDSAIRYLTGLKGETMAKAIEYLQRAPPFVRTPLREAFESKFGATTPSSP
jgi:hypothetical protein